MLISCPIIVCTVGLLYAVYSIPCNFRAFEVGNAMSVEGTRNGVFLRTVQYNHAYAPIDHGNCYHALRSILCDEHFSP